MRHTINHTPPEYPLPWGFNGPAASSLYRWFSGRPMNGHRYSDATALHAGRVATDLSRRASAYHMLPGWKRFAYIRLPIMVTPTEAALLALPDHALGWLTDPWVHVSAGTALSSLAAGRLFVWRQGRVFRSEVLRPLERALQQVLHTREALEMEVPRDISGNDSATATISVPEGWVGDDGDRRRFVDVSRDRLRNGALEARWALHGSSPSVELYTPPQPPVSVSFEYAEMDLASSSETAPVLGYGVGESIVTVSLELESPHILINGPSGGGKSELVADVVAQFLRRGYGLVVFDAKFNSHRWLKEISEVSYRAETEDLHTGLLWLEQELMRRARLSEEEQERLSPLCVVLEEMNSAADRLRAYWAETKPTGAPMKSPALRALQALSTMGREVRMHVIMIAQNAEANATGGPTTRANFGAVIMSGRSTRAQWRMLAKQVRVPPPMQARPGRWALVVGDVVTQLQAPFMNIKKERKRLTEFVTAGYRIPDTNVLMTQHGIPVDPWPEAMSPVDEPTIHMVTLSSFVADRDGLTLVQAQNWRARDKAFPEPVGTGDKGAALYEEIELEKYVASRRATV